MLGIIISIFFLLNYENIHCSKTDACIYRKLNSFLVSENKILAKDTVGIDPFSLLFISNLLEEKEVCLEDDFGVYIFNRIGLEDEVNYILVKKGDSIAVFKEDDPLSIFTYLFAIKEKYPQILNSDHCNEYIKRLIEINRHPIIGIPRGGLLFYSALKQ